VSLPIEAQIPMKLRDWHARFTQQAHWTKDLRIYLYNQVNLAGARRVLEIGCGTGVLLDELTDRGPSLFGLDINRAHLDFATLKAPAAELTHGEAHALPYGDDSFDIALCHFLLLWVQDPLRVVGEMRRITRPGGHILALAEPDYGGRVDYPPELAILGEWQTEALRSQGADPFIGRKLAGIFHRAGLESVETGTLGGQWSGPPDWEAWESEWAVMESDLKEKTLRDAESLRVLKAMDKSAYEKEERILFVPTFYAWGRSS